VSLDAFGVTAGGVNWPPVAAGAFAPPPPLPDAPLVVPLLWVDPPVPLVPPLPPEDDVPFVPAPGVPPLPLTGVDVSGATPWYCACELDWARLAAGAASANDTARKRRQIRLLMKSP
jgi:hypothetical protein